MAICTGALTALGPVPTLRLRFAAHRGSQAFPGAVRSAVEHCFHTAGVTGSIPVPPTNQTRNDAAGAAIARQFVPMSIRTRFAPSPTGMLHIGGVRTALFSWLYARRHGGVFVLRVEDTDRERSTDEATQVILDGMEWLGLQADEGPFYQTRRMDRYREVIGEFLADGRAYHCYCSKEELETMRSNQLAAKQKPRYDGTCRHGRQPRPGV